MRNKKVLNVVHTLLTKHSHPRHYEADGLPDDGHTRLSHQAANVAAEVEPRERSLLWLGLDMENNFCILWDVWDVLKIVTWSSVNWSATSTLCRVLIWPYPTAYSCKCLGNKIYQCRNGSKFSHAWFIWPCPQDPSQYFSVVLSVCNTEILPRNGPGDEARFIHQVSNIYVPLIQWWPRLYSKLDLCQSQGAPETSLCSAHCS